MTHINHRIYRSDKPNLTANIVSSASNSSPISPYHSLPSQNAASLPVTSVQIKSPQHNSSLLSKLTPQGVVSPLSTSLFHNPSPRHVTIQSSEDIMPFNKDKHRERGNNDSNSNLQLGTKGIVFDRMTQSQRLTEEQYSQYDREIVAELDGVNDKCVQIDSPQNPFSSATQTFATQFNYCTENESSSGLSSYTSARSTNLEEEADMVSPVTAVSHMAAFLEDSVWEQVGPCLSECLDGIGFQEKSRSDSNDQDSDKVSICSVSMEILAEPCVQRSNTGCISNDQDLSNKYEELLNRNIGISKEQDECTVSQLDPEINIQFSLSLENNGVLQDKTILAPEVISPFPMTNNHIILCNQFSDIKPAYIDLNKKIEPLSKVITCKESSCVDVYETSDQALASERTVNIISNFDDGRGSQELALGDLDEDKKLINDSCSPKAELVSIDAGSTDKLLDIPRAEYKDPHSTNPLSAVYDLNFSESQQPQHEGLTSCQSWVSTDHVKNTPPDLKADKTLNKDIHLPYDYYAELLGTMNHNRKQMGNRSTTLQPKAKSNKEKQHYRAHTLKLTNTRERDNKDKALQSKSSPLFSSPTEKTCKTHRHISFKSILWKRSRSSSRKPNPPLSITTQTNLIGDMNYVMLPHWLQLKAGMF